jgi:tRNA(Arg) A34 adenosine deaminase TadA
MTDDTFLDDTEREHLAHAIALARAARERGDHPFGAIVVTPGGRVVEDMNSVVTTSDPTGHAETNLVRTASRELDAVELAASTLYTSTEPCAMCAGAIYWSGIGRLVYALGEDALIGLVREQEGIPTLALPSREVFARGGRAIEVIGPVEIDGARAVHDGFWDA